MKIFRNPLFWLTALLILNAAIHLPFVNEPPRSRHVWRQTFTLSVARNFYREEMDIFKPRVDNRGTFDGVTGMQFPAFEYGLAVFYKVLGDHYWVNRIYSLLIFSIGILFIYGWIYQLSFNRWAALTGAWVFCWAPEMFYHGFNALPDILSLTAIAGSLCVSALFVNLKRNWYLWCSMFLLLLAGLTKMQFLMAGTVWVYIYFRGSRLNVTTCQRISIVVSGITVITLTLSWYIYAMNLIKSSGLNEVGLEFRPVDSLSAGLTTIVHNLVSDIPELLIGYGSLVFVLAGIYCQLKFKKCNNYYVIPFLGWLLLFIAYYLIELAQMDEHNYYLLPLLPLLVLLAAAGGKFIHSKYNWLFILLLVAQPVLSSIRIIPSRWITAIDHDEVPKEFLDNNSRKRLVEAGGNSLVIVLGDQSNCIWFYFLEKKGFSVHSENDMLKKHADKALLKKWIEEDGVQVMYAKNFDLDKNAELKTYFKKLLLKEGEFSVIQLQPVIQQKDMQF